MRVRQLSLIAVLLFVGVSALAQERDRGGSQAQTTSGAVAQSASVTPSGNTSVNNTPTYNSSGPTYYPMYDFDYRQMVVTNFLRGLWYQYPYFAYPNLAWRYSQGDSPISQDVIRLALQDSYEATNAIMKRADEMSSLIDSLEAGQISRASFQSRFDRISDDVRRLTKSIRKDDRLEFLDQRRGVQADEPPRATSIGELRALVAQLRQVASGMRDGLETYYERDYSRTVDLEHLKQPSFKSMSNQIEKLCKVIEKSADQL